MVAFLTAILACADVPDAGTATDGISPGTTRRTGRDSLRPVSTEQPKNPLHGLTLEAIVTALVDHYGWAELGKHVDVRCFTHDPSVTSSLKFLRRTPWAREKVESFYLWHLREQKRRARGQDPA